MLKFRMPIQSRLAGREFLIEPSRDGERYVVHATDGSGLQIGAVRRAVLLAAFGDAYATPYRAEG
jgi:hypothetical protein